MSSATSLDLDPADVTHARALARQVGRPDRQDRPSSTRPSPSSARPCASPGSAVADAEGTPWVNRLADVVRADVGLEHGVALPVWDALLRGEAEDLATLAQKASAGSVPSACRRAATLTRARSAARKAVGRASRRSTAAASSGSG